MADLQSDLETNYDATVRQDIELFRKQAEAFWQAELQTISSAPSACAVAFTANARPNVHMIRTKVPGGAVTAEQMHRLAHRHRVRRR